MKPSSALVLIFTTLTSAWNVDLWATDGRHINMHGHADSGCKDISFTPALNVNRAKFDPKTSLHSDPGTFELYVNKGCEGLSYRNGKGDFTLTPARKIRSYKVY